MNEELKIIIKAEVDKAVKDMEKVNSQVKDLGNKSQKSSKSFGGSMKAIGKGVAVAATAVVAAVAAIGAALVKIANSTKEYREEQSKLVSSFQASGSTAKQAQETYKNLYRFLGDSGKATEAAGHLAQLTTSQKALAEWTTIAQGVYATFGDSLPIESMTEAANETAKVGKTTGALADALNWAGVSEDSFNASLAACNTEAEREALIRNTLNDLYSNAAQLYEKNNADILAQNEAQNRLNNTMAALGKTITPLITALTNLANTFMTALAPAINAVMPYIVSFINGISKAVAWVSSFISSLTGSKSASKAVEEVANATNAIGSGFNKASSGAGGIANNLTDATKAAEKLKRTTAGFDELNVMSSGSGGSSSGGASSGGSGGGGGSIGAVGGFDLGLTDALEETGNGAGKFAEKVKQVFSDLKTKVGEYLTLFTPTFEAWKESFKGLGQPITEAFGSIKGSFTTLKDETLLPYVEYITTDFIPTIANNFSENFAPIFSDVAGWAVKQFAADFDWMCQQVNIGVNDVITPALELFKQITVDTTDAIGQEWQKSGESLLTNISGVIESFKEIWDNLYNNIIKPVWDNLLEGLTKLWDEHLKPLWEKLLDFFSSLSECVMTIWNNFLAPIVNWIITVLAPIITNVINTIVNLVLGIVGVIADVIGGIVSALSGLLKFITGVFSGDWKKAWEGIKQFFSGIWSAIWGIVKGIINLIIGAINSLWSGIYSVIKGLVDGIGSIAGAIGDLLGKDWRFSMPKKPPTIPKLAEGGIVNSSIIANIGERGKEAVLPLENNTEWMDVLAQRIAGVVSAPSKIVLMLDGRELGWANINSINGITQETGQLQLQLI